MVLSMTAQKMPVKRKPLEDQVEALNSILNQSSNFNSRAFINAQQQLIYWPDTSFSILHYKCTTTLWYTFCKFMSYQLSEYIVNKFEFHLTFIQIHMTNCERTIEIACLFCIFIFAIVLATLTSPCALSQ